MKETILKLEKELEQLNNRRKVIDDAISALQKTCSHTDEKGKSTYVYDSHDSHKTYYKCTICNKENWG